MNFVLDNSVVMRWFFGDGKPAELLYASKVLDFLSSAHALVPVVWNLEVVNVLSRAEAQGLVSVARSEAFLELLAGVEIEVDTTSAHHVLSSTLSLARRYKLSAYDASYLDLALRHGMALATLDSDLRKAAKKAGAVVLLS